MQNGGQGVTKHHEVIARTVVHKSRRVRRQTKHTRTFKYVTLAC